MAEILSTISIVSFVAAGVCFALAVLLWFLFDIPAVIGDLSGRTARKSIARMREHNEKSGKKSYKPSKTNVERGKLTGTMPDSQKLKKKDKTDELKPETGLLDENKTQSVNVQETALLNESEETALLNSAEETGLLVDENETALLEDDIDIPKTRAGGKKLVMIETVMLIHTDEVI